MQIALAQLNFHIGNFEANERKIIAQIKRAEKQGAELIVFSELAICGYPPQDLLYFSEFIDKTEESILRIAKHCQNIAAIVGGPSKCTEPKNKPWYNSAYFLAKGKVQSIHHKTQLPNYDVFDESRYFEVASKINCATYKGYKIALTICEDLWTNNDTSTYADVPMDILIKEQPDFIINIAASPFSFHQAERRERLFKENAKKYQLPLIYVNQIGANEDLIFDGGSLAYTSKGELCNQLAYFKEDFNIIDINTLHPISSKFIKPKYEKIEEALILGIRDYFQKLGFKKATLGLSGGIDSALSLVIAVKSLGAENVTPIMLPSQFSSNHSISDSISLCKNLGCDYLNIPIKDIYRSFETELSSLFKGTAFDVTEENIQSRIRSTLLMAKSNKFGDILLNTSNKSELAVGYGTLYGDMAGGLSIIGDLYKTEVYELSKHLNKKEKIIPQNIIDKAPSAELRPEQLDSDSLPEYHILDAILYHYIELRKSPNSIIAEGFAKDIVHRIIKLVNQSEYKRKQSMPILRISDKSFGSGRRMPIVGKFLS